MQNENTNWGQSVAGVVLKDEKVLLASHTYGAGKGMYIVPGGYVNYNESPYDAVVREYLEETNIMVKPKEIIAIRFNNHDWYIVFTAEYIDGTAKTDNDENDDVVWMNIEEALSRDDVPELTKTLIQCAVNNDKGLKPLSYEGNSKHGKGYLYGK